MSILTGRSEKRKPIELAAVLSRVNQGFHKESTFTENKSSHGLRVITKKIWRPGARLLVSFAKDDVEEEASVVYCQRLGNKKFAVGLALSAKVHKYLS
jgi:hypothetical protein